MQCSLQISLARWTGESKKLIILQHTRFFFIGNSGNLQHFMDTVRFLTPGKEGKLSQIKAIKCFWRQEVKTLTEGTMYLL